METAMHKPNGVAKYRYLGSEQPNDNQSYEMHHREHLLNYEDRFNDTRCSWLPFRSPNQLQPLIMSLFCLVLFFNEAVTVCLKIIHGQSMCSYFHLPPGKANLWVWDLCHVLVSGFLSWDVFPNGKNFLQLSKLPLRIRILLKQSSKP